MRLNGWVAGEGMVCDALRGAAALDRVDVVEVLEVVGAVRVSRGAPHGVPELEPGLHAVLLL